jgi:hypothetical protein
MIVWYDIEYNKLRMWPTRHICNSIARMDEYMVRLGEL